MKYIKKFLKQGIYIEKSVKLGKNVSIMPGTHILGNSIIGDNVSIGANNYITDSSIENNVTVCTNNHIDTCTVMRETTVTHSYLEQSQIGKNCTIGPYSRLRPKSTIGDNCKIGNFVEIKNSCLGNNTKASHLAYIGDTEIGNYCNIGCGAIFVNYNGKEKNRSIIGNGCFIGSNVNVIAPVEVADNSYICAGTTLTKNTSEYDFVIGRKREIIKPNYAKKYKKEG